jgi:hypothetical protein
LPELKINAMHSNVSQLIEKLKQEIKNLIGVDKTVNEFKGSDLVYKEHKVISHTFYSPDMTEKVEVTTIESSDETSPLEELKINCRVTVNGKSETFSNQD